MSTPMFTAAAVQVVNLQPIMCDGPVCKPGNSFVTRVFFVSAGRALSHAHHLTTWCSHIVVYIQRGRTIVSRKLMITRNTTIYSTMRWLRFCMPFFRKAMV